MRIPKRDVGSWCNEVIARCLASRSKRLMRGSYYRNMYLTGDKDGNPQTFNKTKLHVDRLSSWTFSPVNMRYVMESDGDVSASERAMGKRAITELHKRIRRGGVDRAAKCANKWSRIKGKAFIKLLWTAGGFEPSVIQPEVMGVEREDLATLGEQKAFVHTSWYTIDGFVNLVSTHAPVERDKLIRKAAALAKASNLSDKPDNHMLKQVLIGGMYPYKDGTSGQQSTGGRSQVDWLGGPVPYLAPELAARFLQVDELWVWDDDRDDWTVFQMLSDGEDDSFITGKDRHRNIFADAYDPNDTSLKGRKASENPLAGMTPFVEFCPCELDGYFWGLSDITSIALLQRGINRRIDGINAILRRQEDPPRAYLGMTGMTQTQHSRLSKPGGWITESGPTAKIQDMQPDLPKGLFETLDKLIQYFDDVGGISPTMSGQGDAGIRSDVHAQTLLKTATASVKDQAVEVERSAAELGNLGLQIMKTQVADKLTAWVRKSEAGIEAAAAESTNVEEPPVKDLVPLHFSLHQLPDNMYASIDCHSSSPIFSHEQEATAVELKKLGAITPQDLVDVIQPPHAQTIIDNLERADVARQELIAQHPELLKHGGGKPGK